MTQRIKCYEEQISSLLKEFYSFPKSPLSEKRIFLDLESSDHLYYFLSYIEKLRHYTIYHNFILKWWLFEPTMKRKTSYLVIELCKIESL